MGEHALYELASIIVLGIAAQWLAWRLRFPSILFLLIFGFIAGPLTGFLHPDELLGELLFPVVSISVAVILFEGGLTLRMSELKDVGVVVFRLISLGVLVTAAIASVAAYYILKMELRLAILLGTILVVTGPTVIGPLLMHIRPKKRVGTILKWEGIVIDPVGAILAVLVFEAILAGQIEQAWSVILLGILKTMFFGGIIGFVLAQFLVFLLQRFWVPDFLQETVALILVITAFVLSNIFQPESGLFAVTLMGLALDNEKVSIQHIVAFKENLRVMIISSLFILLAARIPLSDFSQFDLNSALFLAVLIFIARPLSVLASTAGSDLSWRERVFISWLAPRGIVAAAVSSIFAFRLAETNIPGVDILVPMTFLVIVVTVAIYGLTSGPVAKWLGVTQSDPQGLLIMGAHAWGRAIAKILKEHQFNVLLIDSNRGNILQARMEGIPAHYGSVVSEHIVNELDLEGIGRFLALTSNDEANSLAALHLSEIFEKVELYQLPPIRDKSREEDSFIPKHLRGRFLFDEQTNFNTLNDAYINGWRVKSTKLTKEFDYEAFKSFYKDRAIPMFLIIEPKKMMVFAADTTLEPKPGQSIIAMVKEQEQKMSTNQGDHRE